MLRWRLTRERLARETALQTTSPLTKHLPAFPIYADDLDGFYPPKPTTLDSFSSITLSDYKALSEQTSSFSALIKIDVPRWVALLFLQSVATCLRASVTLYGSNVLCLVFCKLL